MPNTRHTIQRDLVLQAVQALRNHPTADEIYAYIHTRHPSVSRGTVYRNLGLLAQQGQILRVTHLDAADRFDFNFAPHHHFLCNSCGSVFDVQLPFQDSLLQQVKNTEGFLFQACHVSFSGLCPTCQASISPWGETPTT